MQLRKESLKKFTLAGIRTVELICTILVQRSNQSSWASKPNGSRYGKTGNKKNLATCFATLLQNELNSDDMLRILPPMFKPVNNLICCKTDFMAGWQNAQHRYSTPFGRKRCKTSFTFFVVRFSVPLVMIFSAFISSSRSSNIWYSYIHHFIPSILWCFCYSVASEGNLAFEFRYLSKAIQTLNFAIGPV